MPSFSLDLRNLEGIPSLMYTRIPPERPFTPSQKGIFKFCLRKNAFVKEEFIFVFAKTKTSMRLPRRLNKLSILFLNELTFRARHFIQVQYPSAPLFF